MGNTEKIICAACMSLLCLPVHVTRAQNVLSLEHNGIRNSDVIYRQRVEYSAPGNSGSGMLWDFRDAGLLREGCRTEFFRDSSAVIRGIGQHSMDKYVYVEDTLFQTGYETPVMKIDYSRPLLKMKYPFGYGDCAVADYKGQGLYSNRNAVDVCGTVRIEADAAGCMIVSDNDTLTGVLRVHTMRTSSFAIGTDTIVGNATDRQLEIYDIYQWFVRGLRYPVFETHEISYYHGSDLASVDRMAFRYLPEMQKSLGDSVNIALYDRKEPEVNGPAKNVISYEMEALGGYVSMKYSLVSDVSIQAFVSDMSGVLYRHTTLEGHAGSDNIMTIDCTGLRHGEYILYISAGGETYSNKIRL